MRARRSPVKLIFSAEAAADRRRQDNDDMRDWMVSFVFCRRHGRGCRVPWGYDEAHTDSDRPYTVDELAARRDGPHRFAYPTYDAYKAGWLLWKALRRDAALTVAESDVVWNARLDRMEERARAVGDDVSDLVARFRR